jgi:hypothetical protein
LRGISYLRRLIALLGNALSGRNRRRSAQQSCDGKTG